MKAKFKTKSKRLIFYLSLFLLISLGIYFLSSRIKTEEFTQLIEKAGFLGPVVFIFAMASTYVIAPLSGTPFYFGGYLFFQNKVQIYNYLASVLAATINFWLAKKWGRGLVTKLVGGKNMDKVDQFTEDYGLKSLILLRVFQGQFHDFISYGFGLTKMRYLPFMIVSALAPIPWLLLWQFYIFRRIKNIGEFAIWWVVTLIPLFIISGFFVSRYKKKK